MPQLSMQHRCAVLVDRHVHKTGGTTLRKILLHNECLDPWVYVGYGLETPDWAPLIRELDGWNGSTPARLLVEVRLLLTTDY